MSFPSSKNPNGTILILNLNREDTERSVYRVLKKNLLSQEEILIIDALCQKPFPEGKKLVLRKTLREYSSNEFLHETVDWLIKNINDFGNISRANGENGLELLEYDGIPLWGLFKFELCLNVWQEIATLRLLNKILESETPKKVALICGDQALLSPKDVSQLCRLKNISFQKIDAQNQSLPLGRRIKNGIIRFLKAPAT